MATKKNRIHTIGRRKTSVARVFLSPGDGKIIVNKLPFDEYFGRATSQMIIKQPLDLIEGSAKFDYSINVSGGGKSGQAGAVRLGISRALLKVAQENRPVLKTAGFLTRDAREVERKKYGKHKARRSTQYSKR